MVLRVGSMMRLWLALGAALLLLLAAGCGDNAEVASETSAGDAPTETTASNRATDPESSAETETEMEPSSDRLDLVSANGRFAFDLYRSLRAEAGNLFFSPYSVSAALTMALVGARGETANQMSDVLGFGQLADDAPDAFGRLDAELASRAHVSELYQGEGFTLHVVNALWPQMGYPFEQAFIEAISSSFGAELQPLDFASDPETARETINDWVSDQTEERIQDLIPPNAVSEGTRLVMTNAIYFNAPWFEPFAEENTELAPFLRLDGSLVGIEMMHRTDTMLYAAWDGGQALEIPYNGNELAMVVLVPDEGAFDAFDAGLGHEQFSEIVASLETRHVSLGLPKFEFEDDTSLGPNLQALGMTDAFDPEQADFSGITGDRDLAISQVLHKAFVSVDEAGTEAAAATAVLFRATGVPAEPIELIVDRPFLFAIRDRSTGAVLFIGRVVDPTA